MANLGMDAWATAGIVVLSFLVLLFTNIAADAVLLSAAMILMLVGILSPAEMMQGFSNLGLATVAILFVVASALTRTGALGAMFNAFLGSPKTTSTAQVRLMFPVAVISSVLNNTPVVAMMIPMVSDWAKRMKMSASQLMMPLSYAAIVGGVCTVIGTSTNLVVNDMLALSTGERLALFDIAWIGVPIVLITVLFVALTSRWLLPNTEVRSSVFGDAKKYTIEMVVSNDNVLNGQTIEKAGLRQLSGMYLIEIIRNDVSMVAVSSSETLLSADRLIFAGDVDSIVDLQKLRGLEHAEDHVFKLGGDRSQRQFFELVLGSAFPHLGVTVRQSEFRKKYGAAIIAIYREGVHLKQRIGDVVLRKGDILMVEAHSDFAESRKFEKDFLLISQVLNSKPVLHNKRYHALAILLGQILLVSFSILSLFEAACIAAILLVATRCISMSEARSSIDWQVLVVIGSSIAIGLACGKTGLADAVAMTAIDLSQGSAYGALVALFIVGAVMTALISNMAAAVVLFPVIEAISQQLGVSVIPFAVTLMVAASVCLATPIGYQTNLMVYGPGNYRFVDFLKMGIPLTIIIGILTVILVPIIWSF